jgi:hypothetical protein
MSRDNTVTTSVAEDMVSISGWARIPVFWAARIITCMAVSIDILQEIFSFPLTVSWVHLATNKWTVRSGVGGYCRLRINCWIVKLATHLHLESSWKIRRVDIHITNASQSKVLAFRKKFNFERGFYQINCVNGSEQTLRVEFLTPIPWPSLHSLLRTCDTDLRYNNVRGMFLSFWIQMPPQGWTNLDILTDKKLCLRLFPMRNKVEARNIIYVGIQLDVTLFGYFI